MSGTETKRKAVKLHKRSGTDSGHRQAGQEPSGDQLLDPREFHLDPGMLFRPMVELDDRVEDVVAQRLERVYRGRNALDRAIIRFLASVSR